MPSHYKKKNLTPWEKTYYDIQANKAAQEAAQEAPQEAPQEVDAPTTPTPDAGIPSKENLTPWEKTYYDIQANKAAQQTGRATPTPPMPTPGPRGTAPPPTPGAVPTEIPLPGVPEGTPVITSPGVPPDTPVITQGTDPGRDFSQFPSRQSPGEWLKDEWLDVITPAEPGSAMDKPGLRSLETLWDLVDAGIIMPFEALVLEPFAQAGGVPGAGPVGYAGRAQGFRNRSAWEQIVYGLLDPSFALGSIGAGARAARAGGPSVINNFGTWLNQIREAAAARRAITQAPVSPVVDPVIDASPQGIPSQSSTSVQTGDPVQDDILQRQLAIDEENIRARGDETLAEAQRQAQLERARLGAVLELPPLVRGAPSDPEAGIYGATTTSVPPSGVGDPLPPSRPRTAQELLDLGGYRTREQRAQAAPPGAVSTEESTIREATRGARWMRSLAGELDETLDDNIMARMTMDEIEDELDLIANIQLPRLANSNRIDIDASVRLLREEADKVERAIPQSIAALADDDIARQEEAIQKALAEFGSETPGSIRAETIPGLGPRPSTIPSAVTDVPVSRAAPSPGRVREIADKWQAAPSRNAARATEDLNALRAEGYLVDDAAKALQEYKDTVGLFPEARTTAWDNFINTLDNAAIPDQPGAISRAAPEGQVAEIADEMEQANQALDEAQATLDGLTSSRGPRIDFGTQERSIYEARQADRRARGEVFVSKAQRTREARVALQAAKENLFEVIKREAQIISPTPLVRFPRALQGKPVPPYRIGQRRFQPAFESDIDEALYIVSKTGKLSPDDTEYMDFLRVQAPDLSDAGIRRIGMAVRNEIKKVAYGPGGGIIRIPSSNLLDSGYSSLYRPDVQVTGAFKTTPLGEAPKVNGAPTGEVRPAQRDPRLWPSPAGAELITVGDELAAQPHRPGVNVIRNPIQAKAELNSELYDAIPGSPIDFAASRYWKEGDINQYFRDLPPDIPVSSEFTSHQFKPIGRKAGQWLDATRLLQTIDNGVANGPSSKFILWPTRRLFMASMRFGDNHKRIFQESLEAHGMNGFRTKELRELSGDVIEHIGIADSSTSISDLLARPAIKKIVAHKSLNEQERIVGFAQDTRRIFDDLLRMQNMARTARGQAEIASLQNYRPWVREANIWARLGLKNVDSDKVLDIPDFIRPNAPFNPRALARTGGLKDYEKVRDLRRLVDDYIDTASKDIFFTDIIRNSKSHTKVLRELGHDNAAANIDDWISEGFAGTKTPITKGMRSFIPDILLDSAIGLRRSLARAVFPLNWTWNLGIQISSIVPTFARYGPINTVKGLDYIWKPSAREWTKSNVYSSIIKGKMGGRVSSQDLTETATVSLDLRRSPLRTAEEVANFLTSVIENNLTGVSVRAGYHNGLTRGLKGRELTEWASDAGSKTQSMYNMPDKPGLLRSQEVQALLPFQTFAFEMFNTVREMALPLAGSNMPGQAGAFRVTGRTQTERLRQLLIFIGGMYVVNMVGDKYLNRKPWVVGSFLPFYGLLTGAINPGSPFGGALPESYIGEFSKGVTDLFRFNSWDGLRKFITRYHMPAGTQANRTINGLIAVSKGEVQNAKGEPQFEVDPGEWITAVTRGPYATKEGQAYIKKIRASKGPFSEMLGFPVPARTDIKGHLEPLELQFGNSVMNDDGEDTIFSPEDYGRAVRDMRSKAGISRLEKEGPPLALEYLRAEKIWEEYRYNLKSSGSKTSYEVRYDYRKANPDVDAALFFWGRVTTLQSRRARNLVLSDMNTFNVPVESFSETGRQALK